MNFRDDDRGASVQVGAIILFGFVVLAVAGWQAQVVPQDNAQVEYSHSQRVVDDMQGVRNGIVSAPGRTAMSSVSVELAPSYPPRTLFVNPGAPSGTIRTVGTTNASLNLTVTNAEATDDETADFWDGSARAYGTGGLAYEPGYNVYDGAPDTVYENTVLYDAHDDGTAVTVAGQDLIEGRTISLVALNGSLHRSAAGVYSVDFRSLSSSSRTVSVTDAGGGNVTLSFASRRSPGWWNETLRDAGEFADQDGHVVDVRQGSPIGGGYHDVIVEFRDNTTYRLRMAKVGVGAGTEETAAAYVVDVEGDGSSVPEGSTQRLVVEVRDAYNNPVPDVRVAANATTGTLNGSKRTGDDGRATFRYEAHEVHGVGSEDATVDVATGEAVDPWDVAVDGSTPENLTMTVTVRNSDGSGLGGGAGGGGAYAVDWTDPDLANPSGPLSDCSATSCTWDVGADSDDQLDLRAATSPTVEDLDVSFHVNDSTVGTLSGSDADTGSTGEASTTLNANANGSVKVYVSGGSASDAIDVEVVNVSAGGGGGGAGPFYDVTIDDVNDPVTEGDDLLVDVTVANTGDVAGTQDITLLINGSQEDVRTDESIAGGASQTYTLAYTTVSGDAPARNVTVSSANDRDQRTAAVQQTMAARTELVAGNNDTAAGDESTVLFDLANVGSDPSNVTGVRLDGTTENKGRFLDNGGSCEFSGAGGCANRNGQIAEGETESLTPEASVDGGQTETFTLGQFVDDKGNTKKMSNNDVTITLFFEDGSQKQYVISVPK